MERNGKAVLVAMLMVAGSFGTLSADVTSTTVQINTYKVTSHRYSDEFTGVIVISAKATNPDGAQVGGADVTIKQGEETSLHVFTPTGILISVNEKGDIKQGGDPGTPAEAAAPAPAP